MAQIDFPASPTNGQLFTPANGITYRWLTSPGIWAVANGPVDTVISSDTPPASPVPNQLWFNASLAMLYVYYDDGTSQQWVPSMPVPAPGAPMGGGIIREVTLAAPAATIDLFSLGVKSVKVMFKLRPVTSSVDCLLRYANGSTPITTATYNNLIIYTIHTAANPPQGLYAGGNTGFLLANLVDNTATKWIVGEVSFPDLTGYQQGTASLGFWQTVFLNFQSQLVGDMTGAGYNGLQFVLSSGNFAAGSFVRVIGWP